MTYTLVRHSGRCHEPGFARGLEPRGVSDVEAKEITQAGGVVVADYSTADKLCDTLMFPTYVSAAHAASWHPCAQGRFTELTCGRGQHKRLVAGGEHIYLPTDADREAIALLADPRVPRSVEQLMTDPAR